MEQLNRSTPEIVNITLNHESVLQYDRRRPLSDLQSRYIQKMDEDMDKGITIDGRKINQPDPLQRAHFVALTLITAIKVENEQLAAATSAYLVDRLPELRQINAVDEREGFIVHLVLDKVQQPTKARRTAFAR